MTSIPSQSTAPGDPSEEAVAPFLRMNLDTTVTVSVIVNSGNWGGWLDGTVGDGRTNCILAESVDRGRIDAGCWGSKDCGGEAYTEEHPELERRCVRECKLRVLRVDWTVQTTAEDMTLRLI